MSGRPQDKTRTRCGQIAENRADRRTLTVVKEVTSTNYLPSFRSELRPPVIHLAHPNDWSRSWCGAPVLGILTRGQPLDCVVCADLMEGRKINNLDNKTSRKRSLLNKIRRR